MSTVTIEPLKSLRCDVLHRQHRHLLLPIDNASSDEHCQQRPEMSSEKAASEIAIDNLTFQHNSAFEPALKEINLFLPKGSRTILVGANGGARPF